MCVTFILKQSVDTYRINIIMPHFITFLLYKWVELIIYYYYYKLYVTIRYFEVVLTHWPFQGYYFCAVTFLIFWVPFDHKFNFKVLLCAAVTICGNQLVVYVYVIKCGWHTLYMRVSKCGNRTLHIVWVNVWLATATNSSWIQSVATYSTIFG